MPAGSPSKSHAPDHKRELSYIPVDSLIPYASNARTHSDEQVAQIAASIRAFGFTNPLLVDSDNGLIAGHGRLLAARKLGMEEVPAIVLDYLSEAQKRALVIADNKLALNAGWDDELLRVEFDGLAELGFDLDLTGFSLDEINALTPEVLNPGLTDEDAVPGPPETPITVLGDIWVLGRHRLMCGDSTAIDAVESLMDGQSADMVFTDPPYGMSYGGGRARGENSLKVHGMIAGDDLSGNDLLQMVSDSVGNAVTLAKSGAASYVCFTWRTYAEFHSALVSVGVEPKACIVWDKKSIGLGNSNYRPQHEFIFYGGGQWYGDKGQSDVWYMSRGATGDYVHPTQKPVELIERALTNSSKPGDVIHDCFGGSGSTLIACEKIGRRAHLMELDPKYCDVIIKRWQDFTGMQAVHAVTGEVFGGARAA